MSKQQIKEYRRRGGGRFLGIVAGLVAAVTYGLNPLFALPLQTEGMDTNSILFFRYFLAIPIVGLMMLARGRSFRVTWKEGGVLLLMGLLMGLSSLLLFESYKLMAAGIASTLLFVYPLMVAVIMAGLFKEHLSALTVMCLLGATAGIALLYNGEGDASLSAFGTALVMGSALSYAIYIVGVNKTCLRNMPTLTVTFYCLLSGILVFAVPAMAGDGVMVPANSSQWLRVGALALLPTALSLVCTTAAITLVGSTITAILGAMEPVTAVLVGLMVFGERLSGKDVAGLLLILFSVSMVVLGGRVGHHITGIRKMWPRRGRK